MRMTSEEENVSSYCENFSEIKTLRDRPFNLQGEGGGGVWFFASFRKKIPDNMSYNISFSCRTKCEFFFQNLTLGYMTKTLKQIFFPSTKIRIFFSVTLGIRIFV